MHDCLCQPGVLALMKSMLEVRWELESGIIPPSEIPMYHCLAVHVGWPKWCIQAVRRSSTAVAVNVRKPSMVSLFPLFHCSLWGPYHLPTQTSLLDSHSPCVYFFCNIVGYLADCSWVGFAMIFGANPGSQHIWHKTWREDLLQGSDDKVSYTIKLFSSLNSLTAEWTLYSGML